MNLISVKRAEDVLPAYRGTPIEELLAYQNLGREHRKHEKASLLVGMCMDNRKALRVPENFTYVLRTGGANLGSLEFKVSFAIALGGVRALCLVAHDQCGMVGLLERREPFVEGLVDRAGWSREEAERHFDELAPLFAIDDAAAFMTAEAARLRVRYPRLTIAPLFYTLADGRLHQLA